MVATVAIVTGIVGVIVIIISYYLAQLLLKYIYGKDYNKLKSDTPIDQTFSKRQKIIIIGLPLCIALLFVILYQRLSEKKLADYIIYGLASVIPNLILMFIILYYNKEKILKELGGNYSVAIAYMFTLIIPFFSYFVFVSLVFSGCQIPFEF